MDDALYTLQLIHPHKSDVHKINDADEMAILLNSSILSVEQLSVEYQAATGNYRTRISTPDPQSKDGRAIYEINGMHLHTAMSSLREHCFHVYQSLAMM